MKNIFSILSFLILSLSSHAQDDAYYNSNSDDVYSDSYAEQGESMSYQAFYDELNRYGSWMHNPDYGYVWIPLQAGAGFSPYVTNGSWQYTEYGWTWLSDFEWGWATFHYGRWYQDPGYGWVWIPGYDWAPAWVLWGQYDNYYCWAPAGPGEYPSSNYGGRTHNWSFVDRGNITVPRISEHVVSNTVVQRNSKDVYIDPIGRVSTFKNSIFFSGPKLREVEKMTGKQIKEAEVTTAEKAGATHLKDNEVTIYRPDIQRVERQSATPSHVSRPEEISHISNRDRLVSQPDYIMPQRNSTMPQRDGMVQQRQQSESPQWSAPRQNIQMQQSQPVQQRPVEKSGGFVPADRPAMQQQRQFSAPIPVQQSAPAPARMSVGSRR